MSETFTDLCKRLEHFETPEWAARAILNREPITQDLVIDPCAGSGVLSKIAIERGHEVSSFDIHLWPSYRDKIRHMDFLKIPSHWFTGIDFVVFMNPPFSKAVEFVEKSIELGAEKILCFQRFAWWESRARRSFWQEHPPARVYICGDRANCWRHDIPQNKRGSSSPTAHAWFVWDKWRSGETSLRHIWKDG